ncbi:hypothetical protein ACEQPO_14005 [Bacillus sp. SL00103]
MSVIEHGTRKSKRGSAEENTFNRIDERLNHYSKQAFYENLIIDYWKKREIAVGACLKNLRVPTIRVKTIQEGISSLMSLEDATGTDDDGSINNDLVEIIKN